jgi:general secretion pathway protein A
VYKKFFKLAEDPFNIVPDPRFLFSTPATDEAFANLLFGVESHKGLILLAGEVGTGKTILLKKLVDRLHGESVATAFVFNPRLNPAEFLDYVLSDFGIDHDPNDKPRMLKVLYQWLLERHRSGQTSVLIVDEAQALSPEVTEEIRLLSNLETPTDKLLQIILSGQPEIEERLAQPEMRQFRQRIALRRRTSPLSLADTARYIAHRIRVARGDFNTIFTPEALASVYRFSLGIPRIINLLCEHALISAYADQRKPIGAETVEEMARQLDLYRGALPVEVISEEAVTSPPSVPPPAEAAKPTPPPTPAPITAPTPLPREPSKPVEERAPAGKSAEVPSVRPPAEVTKPAAAPPPVATRAPAAPPRAPAPAEERFPAQAPAEVATGVSRDQQGGAGAVPVIPATLLDDTRLPPGRARPEVRRPLPRKKEATLPVSPAIHRSVRPSTERTRTLEWALLVLSLMGVVFAGYYVVDSGWLMPLIKKQAAALRGQPSVPATSPASVSAAADTSVPSRPAEETGQKPTPGPPAATVPSDSLRQVAAARPPERTRAEPPSRSPTPPARVARETPEKPKVQELARAAAPHPVGRLLVTSNVPGAAITVNGRTAPDWVTPYTFTDLPPGSYNVVVSRQGYRDAQQSASVEAGQTASVNATLNPPRGEIEISTNPPGAEVLIDGTSYGPSPLRARFDAGQHSFLVRQAGRQPVRGSLTVQDGAVATRTVDLPPAVPAPPRMNVEVASNPPKATVYADGTPMTGETPTSFHLAPGHHTLIIFVTGYRPIRREIDIPETGTVTVNETLSPQ